MILKYVFNLFVLACLLKPLNCYCDDVTNSLNIIYEEKYKDYFVRQYSSGRNDFNYELLIIDEAFKCYLPSFVVIKDQLSKNAKIDICRLSIGNKISFLKENEKLKTLELLSQLMFLKNLSEIGLTLHVACDDDHDDLLRRIYRDDKNCTQELVNYFEPKRDFELFVTLIYCLPNNSIKKDLMLKLEASHPNLKDSKTAELFSGRVLDVGGFLQELWEYHLSNRGSLFWTDYDMKYKFCENVLNRYVFNNGFAEKEKLITLNLLKTKVDILDALPASNTKSRYMADITVLTRLINNAVVLKGKNIKTKEHKLQLFFDTYTKESKESFAKLLKSVNSKEILESDLFLVGNANPIFINDILHFFNRLNLDGLGSLIFSSFKEIYREKEM